VAAIGVACAGCFSSGADPSTMANTAVHPVGIPQNISQVNSVVYDGTDFWGSISINDTGVGNQSVLQLWRMPKSGAAPTLMDGATLSLASAVLFVDATRVYWIENSPAPADTSCKLHAVPKTGGAAVVLSNISDCGSSGAPGGLVVDGNDAWVAVSGNWTPTWNAFINSNGPSGALYHVDLTKGPATNATKIATVAISCIQSKTCLQSDATSLYYFARAADSTGKQVVNLQSFAKKGDGTMTLLATLPNGMQGGVVAISGTDVWYTGASGGFSGGSSGSTVLGHVTTSGAGAATIAQLDGGLYLDVDAASGTAFATRGTPPTGDNSATVNNLIGDGVLRLDTKGKLGFTYFGPVELKPTRVVIDGDTIYLIAPHNIYGFDRTQFQ
jgi:hypothetical protein